MHARDLYTVNGLISPQQPFFLPIWSRGHPEWERVKNRPQVKSLGSARDSQVFSWGQSTIARLQNHLQSPRTYQGPSTCFWMAPQNCNWNPISAACHHKNKLVRQTLVKKKWGLFKCWTSEKMRYLCPKVHLNISVQAEDFIRKERESQEKGVKKVSTCRPA